MRTDPPSPPPRAPSTRVGCAAPAGRCVVPAAPWARTRRRARSTPVAAHVRDGAQQRGRVHMREDEGEDLRREVAHSHVCAGRNTLPCPAQLALAYWAPCIVATRLAACVHAGGCCAQSCDGVGSQAQARPADAKLQALRRDCVSSFVKHR